MSYSNILLLILFIWGIPSTYFRNKFRKIVYQTNDWKINIKPVFVKELRGLFFNLFPEDKRYIYCYSSLIYTLNEKSSF